MGNSQTPQAFKYAPSVFIYTEQGYIEKLAMCIAVKRMKRCPVWAGKIWIVRERGISRSKKRPFLPDP